MSKLARFIGKLLVGPYDNEWDILGSLTRPHDFAVNDDSSKQRITVAADGTAELFDGSETDPFATVKTLWIASDRDLVVQLTFDTAGTYGKEVQTRYVLGSGNTGEMGPPLFDAECQAYANYTEDYAAGTLVYADRVTIENQDGSNSAIVEFFVGKQA